MNQPTLPIVVLAGSDGKPAVLPRAGAGKHPLTGYKGVDVTIRSRPLILWLIERLRSCPELSPIHVAGPARIYGGTIAASDLIDTDASVASNLRTALATLRVRGVRGPVAFTTCDILPRPSDLRAVLDRYRESAATDIWFPLCRVPEDRRELHAFAWKPEYSLVPEAGSPPVYVLPGHLLIVDPEALRLELVLHLLEIAYRTRNRSIATRRRSMVREMLFALLWQDLRHLLGGRLPTLTWTVLTSGARVARELRSGSMLRADLERLVARIAVTSRHRRRFPERGVRLPIVDAVSLAEDIDTEEEAREAQAMVGESTREPSL